MSAEGFCHKQNWVRVSPARMMYLLGNMNFPNNCWDFDGEFLRVTSSTKESWCKWEKPFRRGIEKERNKSYSLPDTVRNFSRGIGVYRAAARG